MIETLSSPSTAYTYWPKAGSRGPAGDLLGRGPVRGTGTVPGDAVASAAVVMVVVVGAVAVEIDFEARGPDVRGVVTTDLEVADEAVVPNVVADEDVDPDEVLVSSAVEVVDPASATLVTNSPPRRKEGAPRL